MCGLNLCCTDAFFILSFLFCDIVFSLTDVLDMNDLLIELTVDKLAISADSEALFCIKKVKNVHRLGYLARYERFRSYSS